MLDNVVTQEVVGELYESFGLDRSTFRCGARVCFMSFRQIDLPESLGYDELSFHLMEYRNRPFIVETLRVAVVVSVLLILPSFRSSAQAVNRGAQLKQAERFMDSGNWQKAEEVLAGMLRAQPNDAEALNLMGIADGKQGRLDDAESNFHKATLAKPSLGAAWANLAQIYEQRGDSDRALRTLEQGLSYSPNEARLLFQAAAVLAEHSQFSHAVQRLDAVPVAARGRDYWELRARVQLSAGNLAEAEANLLRASNGKPDSVPALQQLAGIALKRGETERAWQYLRYAVQLAPNSPELLYEYGQASLQARFYGEAVLAMRKALLMEPDRPEYLFLLGSALLETPDYHEALPDFRRYVELRPDDAMGHLSLGWSLFLEKNFPEARTHLEETLRLAPKQPDAWYHLGMIAYETNDDPQALECFGKALELAPAHVKARWGTGMVYAREGDYKTARENFEVAVRLDPDEPKFHYQLSQAYARLEQKELAQRELQLYKETQAKSEERVNRGLRSPSPADFGRRP